MTIEILQNLERTFLSSRTALAACMLACGLGAGCLESPVPPSADESDAASPAEMVGTTNVAITKDPNCQVNVAPSANIRNYFGQTSGPRRKDATNAIAKLTFADLFRSPPFRINGPGNLVRLDVQGSVEGGGRNWQVQINGITGNSTISHMIIAGSLAGASTRDRQRFVERSARKALVESLRTGKTYNVTGICK